MNIWEKLPFLPNRHRMKTAWRSFRERIRGLDFTMPDQMRDRNRNDGAMYYASPENTLRGVFSAVNRDKYSRFLDVGCGKGFVLTQAKRYGFQQVGGVEYDERLCRVCRRNLERLGMAGEVQVHQGDACTFDGYGSYDVFYFFNPFQDAMMRRVIRQITAQCRGREILLIYYHPRYPDAIESCGFFKREQTLYDPVKKYEIYIYTGRIPEENMDSGGEKGENAKN